MKTLHTLAAVRLLILIFCIVACVIAGGDQTTDEGGGEDDADTDVPSTGITKSSPFHGELDLLASTLDAEMFSNCFDGSIRVGKPEACVLGKFPFAIPMVCIRFHNNYPGNIIEASTTYMHFSSQTLVGEESMKIAYAIAKKKHPANFISRKLGRTGNSDAGGYQVHARTQWPPLGLDVYADVMFAVSAGNLCTPAALLVPHQGYIYVSDLDPSWNQKVISPYWTFPLTSGPTVASKLVEQVGGCSADLSNLLCFGGWCSVYPATGRVVTTSPALALLCAMWRAQEITNGSLPMYGLNSLGLGPGVLAIHNPGSYAFSVPPILAGGPPKYGRNSYVQWLFPGTTTLGKSDRKCQALGVEGPGTIPPLLAAVGSETFNHQKPDPTPDNTLALMYWPRFTCCNYCQGSRKSPGRFMRDPEHSYIPALSHNYK